MKYNEIKYAKKFNIGNYESEDFSISASLEEGETPSKVFSSLRDTVHKAFSGEAPAAEDVVKAEKAIISPSKETVIETEGAKETKRGRGRPKKEENKEDDNGFEDDDLGGATAAPKKNYKPKVTVYDRSVDAHRRELSSILNSKFPGWNTDEGTIKKAKQVSSDLNGKPFMDENGEVLPEFVKAMESIFEKDQDIDL